MEVQVKLLLLACLTIHLLLSSSSQAKSFNYCTRMLYPVQVSGVEISPDPVRPGHPATFNITASTVEVIPGANLVLSVQYFGLRVHQERRDLCEELSCPITAGKFVLSHTQSLPNITPPGTYHLRMTLETEVNRDLTCITFGFRVGRMFLASDA